MKKTIECKQCKGSCVIYIGVAYGGVVMGTPCVECKATGKEIIEFEEFTGIKKRNDIDLIDLGYEKSMTYEQYINKLREV